MHSVTVKPPVLSKYQAMANPCSDKSAAVLAIMLFFYTVWYLSRGWRSSGIGNLDENVYPSTKNLIKLELEPVRDYSQSQRKNNCEPTVLNSASASIGLPRCFQGCYNDSQVQTAGFNWTELEKEQNNASGKNATIFVSLSVCWDNNTRLMGKQNFNYRLALR